MIKKSFETTNYLLISYKHDQSANVFDVDYSFGIIDANEDIKEAIQALIQVKKSLEEIDRSKLVSFEDYSNKDFFVVVDKLEYKVKEAELIRLSYPLPKCVNSLDSMINSVRVVLKKLEHLIKETNANRKPDKNRKSVYVE
jgi:hypothetical protein